MEFIVYSPEYRETSGGIVVLHKLNTSLNNLGYNSTVCTFGTMLEVKDEIVIYPEIVEENPLNAKNIVRWELNRPGVVSNFIPDYSKEELVVSYTPSFNENVPNLTVFQMPSLIKAEKEFDTVVLARRKSNIYHTQYPTITKITPENRHWVAKCNTFISYDEYSFLSLEAAMYGATSIVIGNDYKTWKLHPFFKYGVGYNDSIWSDKTKHLVYDYLTQDIANYCNDTLNNFVKLCQQHFQNV